MQKLKVSGFLLFLVFLFTGCEMNVSVLKDRSFLRNHLSQAQTACYYAINSNDRPHAKGTTVFTDGASCQKLAIDLQKSADQEALAIDQDLALSATLDFTTKRIYSKTIKSYESCFNAAYSSDEHCNNGSQVLPSGALDVFTMDKAFQLMTPLDALKALLTIGFKDVNLGNVVKFYNEKNEQDIEQQHKSLSPAEQMESRVLEAKENLLYAKKEHIVLKG